MKERLRPLAHDLARTHEPDVIALWQEVDPWRAQRVAPAAMWSEVEASRWEELARSPDFVARAESALSAPPPACRGAVACPVSIAYLSMEFGLDPSLPIYSGGLGVLAGDHLRSAADLGIPLTGFGLLWRDGYFRQLVVDGCQVDAYPRLDTSRAPISPVGVTVKVPLGPGEVHLALWEVRLHGARLILLDADLPANSAEQRTLTARLYAGDATVRIRQEVMLGLGAMAAARALGIATDVVHLNEGHCAFAILALAAERLAAGDPIDDAFGTARGTTVFTTHTPVPAGHDRFERTLVDEVLGPWLTRVGLPLDRVMALGREGTSTDLNMTALALRGSRMANGVSALHGSVSRKMWHGVWPDLAVDDVPIRHITNGVHPGLWVRAPLAGWLDRVAPEWRARPWEEAAWQPVRTAKADAFAAIRETLRADLRRELTRRTGQSIPADVPVVGFARRFAPYKRGDLLLSDGQRAAELLEQMVVVYAGKAHPRDLEGQAILARVARLADTAAFRGRVFLLENYDMHLGALLTSGCDVWLNHPRRPQEASGTSGQKAAINGVLHASILDGWWPEAWDGTNGFGIGGGFEHDDPAILDAADREAVLTSFTHDILPAWRNREGWTQRSLASIATCGPRFNSHRMVRDYVRDVYLRHDRDDATRVR